MPVSWKSTRPTKIMPRGGGEYLDQEMLSECEISLVNSRTGYVYKKIGKK